MMVITSIGSMQGTIPLRLIRTRAMNGNRVPTELHTSVNTGMTASSTITIKTRVTFNIMIGQVTVSPTRFRSSILDLKSLVIASSDPLRKLLALLV